MSENVGAIEYTCSIELDEFLRNKNRLQREIDDVEKRGDQMGAAMTTMAKAVAGAIAAIQLGKLITGLIDTQRQFDVMNSSLKTMTGSQEAANAAFSKLQEIAAKTPFDLEQVVGAFTKMKALGLDPSRRALMSYSDTASAMGKSLNQLVEAVADASTGQFERLLDFGIKSKKQGDDVTFTFQGVETKIKASSDNIVEYLTRIGEVNFAGASVDRAATLDGKISNLQDSIQALYREINNSGFGEAVAKSVELATEAIQQMTKSIEGGELTSYFDSVKKILPVVEVAAMSLAGAMASRLVAAFIATATQAAASATAMGAATIAARGFAGAMALVGGPIGLAITALGLLALNWDKVSLRADDAARVSEKAAERIRVALAGANPSSALGDVKAGLQKELENAEFILNSYTKSIYGKADAEAIAKAQARVDAIKKGLADVASSERDIVAKANSKTGQDDSRELARRGRSVEGYGIDAPPPPPDGGSGGTKTPQNKQVRGGLDDMDSDTAKRWGQWWERDQNARDRDEEKTAQEAAREAERKAQEQARGQQQATGFVNQSIDAVATPEARIEDKYAADLAKLEEFNAQKLLTEQQYADAQFAIAELHDQKLAELAAQREEAERQKQLMMLNSASQGFGALADMIGTFAGKQSGAYKAMFAVSKAFAIASSIMNISKGMGDVLADGTPWPAKIAGMAMVASAGASIVSTIKGASFGGGRQFGGPVSAGSMYRVNETGRPEMFTSNTGAQYMLPTANGSVTPANKLGGGGAGGSAQQAAPNVTLSPVFQGVQMPDGWFAVRPEAVADALKVAYRDGHLAGFRG